MSLRNIFCLYIIFMLFPFVSTSNTYKGKIIDKTTNQPIAYVNIGIFNKNIGTISDKSRSFELKINEKYINDTLRISSIGYETQNICIKDISTTTTVSIYLEQKTYELKETIVKPNFTKRINKGINRKSSIRKAYFRSKPGFEAGIKLEFKKNSWLQKINLCLFKVPDDSTTYRINIYSCTGENDLQNILKKPIFITLYKDIKFQSVDISEHLLCVTGEIMVTLEHIEKTNGGLIYFYATLGKKSYWRPVSHGKWEKVSIGMGLNIDALTEK